MLRSLGLMAVLTLAWGMNWSVMKIGAAQLPPLWFRSIGVVFGLIVMGAILLARRTPMRLPPGGLREIVRLSVPNVMIWYSVVTIAITMLPAGRAAILGFTMPAWAALIGVFVHRERLSTGAAIGVACALVAVFLMLGDDWGALVAHPLGVALMLFAAMSWAWGTHAIARTTLTMDTMAITFWMMLVACPVLFAASAALEFAGWRVPHGIEWWPILYNAILVLAIGNLIWFTVARTLSPTAAGLSTLMIPVLGVFSGIALLGERPTWRDYAALALICVAVGTSIRRSSTPKATARA